MDWINIVLFTLGDGKPVILIDLLAAVAGLTCVYLAGRNSRTNFYVGYAYTALLFLMFLDKNLYASLMLQPISLGINILGHYRWSHPKAGEESASSPEELKVSMLTWPQRILTILSVLVLAGIWGRLLHMLGGRFPAFPSDPVPYLDSCVTVLILAAQLLSALKKWDCWVVWMIVNITQMALHISVGNVFMPIVSGLYLANGLASIVRWKKLYNGGN